MVTRRRSMSSFFYNNIFFLQFIFWIIPLAFLPNECLAELKDLIKYEDKHENSQIIKLALNESGNEKKEPTDVSKELTQPENLSYPLFMGLCCGKCGGNMPFNIFGAGTPEPHEFRIKMNLSWGKMVGMRRGTSNRSTKDTLGQYMMTPRKMDMYMSSVSDNSTITPYKMVRYYVNVQKKINNFVLLLNGNYRNYNIVDENINRKYSDISGKAIYEFSSRTKLDLMFGYRIQKGPGIDLDLLTARSEFKTSYRQLYLKLGASLYSRKLVKSENIYSRFYMEISRRF